MSGPSSSSSSSLADLIHAHSYNIHRQVADGRSYSSRANASSIKGKGKRRAEEIHDDEQQRRAAYSPPPASSFFIPTLPGLSPASQLTLFGGHLPSTVTSAGPVSSLGAGDGSDDSHIFFFLARAKHIAEREKLLIWLNGGPGCSSFDGALMEIGPLRMVEGKKGQVMEQPGAWNEYSNVLFLDQPVSTGYSYMKGNHYVRSGDEASQQLITFLRNFYDVFPEYERMDLYIAGESFAGIWIPYFADALQRTTVVKAKPTGILIGNGWIDPYEQYPAYLSFAYDTKLITKDTQAARSVESAHKSCEEHRKRLGKADFPINLAACEGVLGTITTTTMQVVNGKTYCVNNYDIRLTDTHPACGMNWPILLKDMYEYLPTKDVVDAFHASSMPKPGWSECGGHVADSFWNTKPAVHLLPGLLQGGVKVLLFSGMQDLICNHMGTERSIDNLSWNGKTGWSNASSALDWFVDGAKAGTWRSERNLTYVQVFNASHMVPYDVPMVAHDMFARFTSTDYISAAGAAASVPSRIGNEEEAIVGETHVNGTALDASTSAVAVATEKTKTSSPLSDAYYNIGAALLVLFVILGFGTCFVLRQRARRRSVFSTGSPFIGMSTLHKDGSHKRTRSSASRPRRSEALENGEETNELLPPSARSRMSTDSRDGNPREHRALPRGEELFAVGEEDEEDDVDELEKELRGDLQDSDEGNIGKPTKKHDMV